MNALSGIYGRVARARRAWYRPPHRQRHLGRPVVSIGNLVVGGSGKTPAVAAVARILQDMGERPAILSRGYGRRSRAALTVVCEGQGPLASVTESGDEPQMLARALPGVFLVVGADRYRAGLLAEARLGATVHVLDDGFQHVRLARDVDLLLVSAADLDEQVLPMGRLREPVEAGLAADAVIVPGPAEARARVQAALGVSTRFEAVPMSGPLRRLRPFGDVAPSSASQRVTAVAGIARPERFVESLRTAGFEVATVLTFRDHHWFDDRDVRRIEEAARQAGTSTVVTTEKDAVRIEPLLSGRASGGDVQWTYQPYEIRIEPDSLFRTWLSARLESARRHRDARFA